MARLIPYFVSTVVPICWASGLVLSRGISLKYPPFGLVFWQMMLSFLCLLPFAWKSLSTDWPVIKREWGALSLISLGGISGIITLLYVSVHTTKVVSTAMIITAGLFLVLGLMLYGKENISPSQVAGIGLCLLGACYVVFQSDWHSAKKFFMVRTELLILILATLYGLFAALLPRSVKLHPFTFLLCIFGLGAITLLPFYSWEILSIGITPITQKAIISIVFTAVFPALVAWMCWNQGAALIGPNRTGITVMIAPNVAVIMSLPFVKAPVNVHHLIGMAFIYSGMILFNRRMLKVNGNQ